MILVLTVECEWLFFSVGEPSLSGATDVFSEVDSTPLGMQPAHRMLWQQWPVTTISSKSEKILFWEVWLSQAIYY